MSNKKQEEAHLEQADRHIADAEEMISRLRSRIMLSTDEDDERARQITLLRLLSESLELMHRHRALILDAMNGKN